MDQYYLVSTENTASSTSQNSGSTDIEVLLQNLYQEKEVYSRI